MFFKKKGSLELSVNAIVILILAIGILGLGIGFVKTMFDKTTNQIKDINKDLEKKLLDDLRDSSERIALDQDNLEILKGKDEEIYMGLRNELAERYTFDIDTGNTGGSFDVSSNPGKWNPGKSVITCYTAFDTTARLSGRNEKTNTIAFTADKKMSIDAGSIFVGKILISVGGKAPPGTYNCGVVISDPTAPNEEYARKDFMITIPDRV